MRLDNVIDAVRNTGKQLMHGVAGNLNRITKGKVSPTSVTLVGLAGHVLVAYLIATRHPIWAAGFFVFFGLFDAIDGELARVQKRSTPTGMLLDSVSDRTKEVMLYIGVAYFYVVLEYPYYAVWAVAACGASLLVSYVNAWGEAVMASSQKENHKVNQKFRSGLMTFDVRMFLFLIGLVTSLLPEMLIAISILSAFTAVGRLVNVSRRLSDV